MPDMMRARHTVYGVKDVPKTDHYLNNGWTEMDPAAPTTAQERRTAENEVRRGTFNPAEHPATEVVEHLEVAPPEEKERVLAEEKSGKARKTILNQD